MGYAILVVGFGLDFRPLHHDEVVTLHVAGQPSAGDVLHVAIWDRHGPPLHYLIVHASLDWRHDILGLRLPSALFGILAVGLAYGCGRELMGRAGGATMAVVTAVDADHHPPRPVRPRIHRDDRLRVREPVADARAPADGKAPVGRAVRPGRAAPGGVASVRPLRARLRAGAPGRARRVRDRDEEAPRPARDRGARRRARSRRRGVPLAPSPVRAAPVQVRRGERRRGGRPDVAVVLERPRIARHRVIRPGVLVPRGSGRRARDRLARIPRPPGGDRRHGVARPAVAPASDPHGVIRRLRARAPPFVPAARVLDRALRVRARARPPARAAPDRRGRSPRHAAHAAPRVGPERPLELQRRSPRREPRPRGRVRPPRHPPDVGGRRRPARGPAPARRVRRP